MQQLTDTLPDGRGARHLVVCLPGAYDRPQAFFDEGFVAALRARHLAADVIALDSHLGYFENATIAERVVEDVLQAARARGCERIWLVGISLGGLGAMLSAERFAGVDGIVAIAPYVGTREAVAEVRRAGGFDRWQPTPDTRANAWEQRLFAWLGRVAARDPALPRIVLAYGRDDRFADSLALVAQAVGPQATLTLEGGHDWPTWRALWQRVLDAHAGELAPTLAPAA